MVAVLQKELDQLEEERLALKTEYRKLAHQCGGRAAKLGLEPGVGCGLDYLFGNKKFI